MPAIINIRPSFILNPHLVSICILLWGAITCLTPSPELQLFLENISMNYVCKPVCEIFVAFSVGDNIKWSFPVNHAGQNIEKCNAGILRVWFHARHVRIIHWYMCLFWSFKHVFALRRINIVKIFNWDLCSKDFVICAVKFFLTLVVNPAPPLKPDKSHIEEEITNGEQSAVTASFWVGLSYI